MHRNSVRSLALASVVALLVCASPAAAKFMYFSIEVSPSHPVAGDEVVITVRLWDDADHTQPSTWWSDEPIAGLVEFRGHGRRIPVTLLPRGAGTYGAEVALAEGTWRLVPCPLAGGGTGQSAGIDDCQSPLTVIVSPRMAATLARGGAPNEAGIDAHRSPIAITPPMLGLDGGAIAVGALLSLGMIGLLIGGPVRRWLPRGRRGVVAR